jgi:hypothetical protein
MYVNRKWREIPSRNLQHRLQTSNNVMVSSYEMIATATFLSDKLADFSIICKSALSPGLKICDHV